MLETLDHTNTVVGAKQARRALSSGRAEALFVADDADPRVTQPLMELAREKGVTVNHIPLMKTLGRLRHRRGQRRRRPRLLLILTGAGNKPSRSC